MARRSDLKRKIKKVEPEPEYIPQVQVDYAKEAALKALKASGYDATSEDGVIMVSFDYHGDAREMPDTMKKVHEILEKAGYDRSYGCRPRRSRDG